MGSIAFNVFIIIYRWILSVILISKQDLIT